MSGACCCDFFLRLHLVMTYETGLTPHEYLTTLRSLDHTRIRMMLDATTEATTHSIAHTAAYIYLATVWACEQGACQGPPMGVKEYSCICMSYPLAVPTSERLRNASRAAVARGGQRARTRGTADVLLYSAPPRPSARHTNEEVAMGHVTSCRVS